MKEGAARAVLREAWLRGQRCVELQRDGKRTIFVCTRCGTRCYSDAALVDHLQGNVHARLSVALTSEKATTTTTSGNRDGGEERAIVGRGSEEERLSNDGDVSASHDGYIRGGAKSILVDPNVAGPSRTSLEWIGSGELFFSVSSAGAASVVDCSWFNWKGKGKGARPGWQGEPGGIAYAVVKFPYSDMIGRGGDWKPWSELKQAKSHGVQSEERVLVTLPSTSTQTSSLKVNNTGATPGHQAPPAFPKQHSPISMETMIHKSVSQLEVEKQKHGVGKGASSRLLRRVCKRKKAKAVERLCFICHQRMSSGKDVAALLNLQTKQMVCGSRNKRGVFHVYHSSCLIDWISICELKKFTGQVDHRIDHTRKLTRPRRAIVEQSRNAVIQGDGGLSNVFSEGAIFCPECQGTGLNLRGAQLERPRYRLAQVFDWILELIQARKAWTEHPKKQDTSRCGLLFREHLEVDSLTHAEEKMSTSLCQEGIVQSRGFVHYYSGCGDLLAGNSLERFWTS